MRRNLSEDTMSSYSGEKPKYCSSNNKKGHSWFECSKGSFGKGSFNNSSNKRLLVVINVLGSAGPLKFVVNEEDFVGGVIDTSLKLYAKERRLPVLGSDSTNFLLYCANTASDALSPWDEIGSCGGRSFVLCKKPEQPTNMTEARSQMILQKRGGSWRAWLNKSLSLKI